MRVTPEEDMDPRTEARDSGSKRYHGHTCKECGGTWRFVHDNSCVDCKKLAARERYYRITEAQRRYAEAGGDARINPVTNRQFLSALAREKAGLL